jgi:hypothetical protein
MQVISKNRRRRITLSLYSNKNSTIASGATPIGSAGRAPDEDGNIGFTIRVNYRLHHQ